MKKRPLDNPAPRLGSIHRDEVLPLREAARRMGWANKLIADVQRAGLQTVTIGRMKYVTGNAIYRFIEHAATMAADKAERQAGREGGGDAD
jgi:hypothetical protein